jgi:hypothetical protein
MAIGLLSGAGALWIATRRRRRWRAARGGEPRRPRPRPVVEPGVVVKPQAPPEVETVPEAQAPPEAEAPPKAKPATWQVLEPTDLSDMVPHEVYRLQTGVHGWRLAGASRRGKMHAHHGTYREDAFALGVAGHWHLVAVSDGAGSCRLSRVGSHRIVETSVARMKEILTAEPDPAPERLRQALDEALQAAHTAVHQEAKERELPVKEFSATFLLLAHGVVEDGHVLGSIQVGDGLIAVQYQDGSIEPLAERDSGAFGGETYFLTSRPVEDWLGRGAVRRLEQPPKLLAAMSDGVADDFIPYDKHLHGLFATLGKVVGREEGYREGDVAQVLLRLIGYDKRGSFDDRTLVMVYQELAEYE